MGKTKKCIGKWFSVFIKTKKEENSRNYNLQFTIYKFYFHFSISLKQLFLLLYFCTNTNFLKYSKLLISMNRVPLATFQLQLVKIMKIKTEKKQSKNYTIKYSYEAKELVKQNLVKCYKYKTKENRNKN